MEAFQRVSGIRYRTQPRAEAEFSDQAIPTEYVRRRRIGPRQAVDLDLSDWSEHNFYAGLTEQAFINGVFVATHRLKPLGEKMAFTINLPGSLVPVTGVGEVSWIREYNEHSDAPPGMGIRFRHLELGEPDAVEAFLSTRDPLLFDDE